MCCYVALICCVHLDLAGEERIEPPIAEARHPRS